MTAAKIPARAAGTIAELASELRPALLRVSRVLRNQRVDTSTTLTQLSAMATLAHRGPMSAGELAQFECVQPPSMTKIIAALEEKGLVTRRPHPDDRRQAILEVTDAGQVLLDEERKSRNAWLTQQLAALTPAERAALRDAIPVFVKLAEQ